MDVNYKCAQQRTYLWLINLDRNNSNNVLYSVKSQVKFVIKFRLKGTEGRNVKHQAEYKTTHVLR